MSAWRDKYDKYEVILVLLASLVVVGLALTYYRIEKQLAAPAPCSSATTVQLPQECFCRCEVELPPVPLRPADMP